MPLVEASRGTSSSLPRAFVVMGPGFRRGDSGV
jgi:hypothetical protein